MVVMIYAYESIFCGLYGINTGGIIDSDELDELTLNISILESFIRNVKE